MPSPWRLIFSVTALGLAAATPAAAQTPRSVPVVAYIAPADHPPMPDGLQLVCMPVSGQGAPNSDTCPVVQYQGLTTWAYSYTDNRNSLALVSYDADKKVVRNVEKGGARYLFNASVSEPNQTVTFVGQAEQWITVPWSELGTP